MKKNDNLTVKLDASEIAEMIDEKRAEILADLPNGPQRRFANFEFRMTEGEGEKQTMSIRGYGSVFNILSEDLGGFREMIHPGAFDRALAKSDIRCLFNHNPDLPLGRTGANLTVQTDATGLAYECSLLDTTAARDLKTNIDAGVITQSSFAFTVDWEDESETKWKFERTDTGDWILHHYDVEELFDVSPVTYPAYKAAGVRSAIPALQRAKEAFKARKAAQEAIEKAEGQPEDIETITAEQARRARQIQINRNRNF